MIINEKRWQKAMDICAPSCHQRSDRSFFYHGWQFPVCARCTGLYIGYVFGLLLLSVSVQLPLWTCGLGILLMLLDWSVQFAGIRQSSNIRRFISGCYAGTAIIQLLGFIIRLALN